MQYFGNYELRYKMEYLTKSYLYVPIEEEEISIKEFTSLIKTKKDVKKNIAGTVIMYNPFIYPIGYVDNKFLNEQGYDFEQGFVELKIEREMTLIKQALLQTDSYAGKLIEIKFLFSLNTNNIDRAEMLAAFNKDTELLNTEQYTIYDKEFNYIDVPNTPINGKFVFFAWGHKINKKEFLYINVYAKSYYDKCVQDQKKISFVFRKSTKAPYAIEHLQFLNVIQTGRFSSNMTGAVKNVFKQYPPMPSAFDDLQAKK